MIVRPLALICLVITLAAPLDAQWLPSGGLGVQPLDRDLSSTAAWTQEGVGSLTVSPPSGGGFHRTALFASAGSTLGVLAGLALTGGGYEEQLTAALLGGTAGAITGAGLAAPRGQLGPTVGIAALGAAVGVVPGVGLALMLPVPALAFGAGQGVTTAAAVHLLR